MLYVYSKNKHIIKNKIGYKLNCNKVVYEMKENKIRYKIDNMINNHKHRENTSLQHLKI